MDCLAVEAVSPTSLGDVTVPEAASEMSPANASSSRLKRLDRKPEEQSSARPWCTFSRSCGWKLLSTCQGRCGACLQRMLPRRTFASYRCLRRSFELQIAPKLKLRVLSRSLLQCPASGLAWQGSVLRLTADRIRIGHQAGAFSATRA